MTERHSCWASVAAGHSLKGWHINLDYIYYPISDILMPTDISNDAYTDVVTLQLFYRFGDKRTR